MAFRYNVTTGTFDIVDTTENFSYNYIDSDRTVIVPVNQQMLYVGPITVDGVLILDGSAIEV